MSKNNPDSFRYLYSLVNNPSHYSLPRTFRLGLSLTFLIKINYDIKKIIYNMKFNKQIIITFVL